MSAADLKVFVMGTDQTSQEYSDEYMAQCWDEAVALVNGYVGLAEVPEVVLNRAYLEVGSELVHRRSAPNGIAGFNTFDGSAIRVARDPLVGAYPLLRRYVGWGVA